MADLKFTNTHNLVAFLSKPAESEGFEQIVDFLNANPIRYALTINPTIYISCIEQFWSTVKAKTVNGEVQLHALVDGKKIIITESTMRRDLQLEDAEGVDCLPNSTIFEQLTLMGYEKISQKLTFYKAFFSPQWKFLIHTILQCLSSKTTAWNEFSSTMASAIICLATNQKFNFSKYIFESMVKNLDNMGKFLMEVQLHALVDGKKIITTESTMRRDLQLEDAKGVDCLLNSTIFEQLTLMGSKTIAWNEFSITMASAIICLATNQKLNFSKYIFESMVKNLDNVGKILMYPRERFFWKGNTIIPNNCGTRSSRMGEGSTNPTDPHHTPTFIQPSTSQHQKKQKPRKSKRKDTQIPQSSGPTEHVADEVVYKELDDSLVRAVTTASSLEAEVLDLEKTKTTQAEEILSLKWMVKKLEQKKRSRTHGLKRLYKVGLTAWVESSGDEESLGEDASKQGRINAIDAIPLATKPPTIVDWKIHKEGKKNYY
ncbi:hypothetical protein Tco_0794680 [Tanacetum coccineum]